MLDTRSVRGRCVGGVCSGVMEGVRGREWWCVHQVYGMRYLPSVKSELKRPKSN